MDISINGIPADIVPDTEKNLGELLSGLELWFSENGRRLSGLRVNGETIAAGAMDEAFRRDLAGITSLEISISSWPELAVEALSLTREALEAWGKAAFEDRGRIRDRWEKSAAAGFLSGEISDVFALAGRAFGGESPGPAELAGLIDERIRETADPRGEFNGMEKLADAVAGRLEDLPLDIQTGKDGRAAETVQLFSRIVEKLFRLLSLLKLGGFSPDTLRVESLPFQSFIGEFDAALKELLAAYGTGDTVLVGDLAEYELAPRLRKFYGAIRDSVAGLN